MMAGWMVFGLVLGGLLGLAGAALERGMRALGRSTRWVWVATLVASLALPAAGVIGSRPDAGQATAADVPTSAAVVSAVDVAQAGPIRWGIPVPRPAQIALAGLWIASSLILLLLVVGSTIRIRARLGRGRHRRVSGRPVLVSRDVGPAVVGVRRPRIVVPQWVLGCGRPTLDLVLLHEEEHLRARDTLLLAGGLAVLILTPWNVAVWWQFHRLRLAIELDCDRRVLARGTSTREYGEMLLEMGRRKANIGLAAAAVAEPASTLERRLRAMTKGDGGRSSRAGLAGLGVAGLMIVIACQVPPPTEVADQGGSAAEAAMARAVDVAGSGAEARGTDDALAAAKRFEKALYEVDLGAAKATAADEAVGIAKKQDPELKAADGREPGIWVDGERMEGETAETALAELDPDQIDRIEVLKGEALEAFAPGEDINGAVLIYTKGGN